MKRDLLNTIADFLGAMLPEPAAPAGGFDALHPRAPKGHANGGRFVKKPLHYGPGPHPGGSPQSVHGGSRSRDLGEMDEEAESQRFTDAGSEIASGLNWDDQSEAIGQDLYDWGTDSHSRSAVAYHIAASQEFGASLSPYTLDQARSYGIRSTADFSRERAILRYIYEHKAQYKSGTVRLYRATDQQGRNALESWTISPDIAQFYVRRNEGGRVISADVPAFRILGSWRDGIGLEFAKEVIVLGGGA